MKTINFHVCVRETLDANCDATTHIAFYALCKWCGFGTGRFYIYVCTYIALFLISSEISCD